tara:strand:- start:622 stop:942 length:321 start_codon:yes stop_codon:yes gene_type:complete
MSKPSGKTTHVVTVEVSIPDDDAIRIDPYTMEAWEGHDLVRSIELVTDLCGELDEVETYGFYAVSAREVVTATYQEGLQDRLSRLRRRVERWRTGKRLATDHRDRI